jgi:uncharacterized protein YydD (DUF2326 family)
MLLSLKANQSSFRSIAFKPGFNVVAAEKQKDSSNKDSRNGLGKTTLIEIIHFCLGSTFGKTHQLAVEELVDWRFDLEILLDGQKYIFSRSTTEEPRKINVYGDISDWDIESEEGEGFSILKIEDIAGVLTTKGFSVHLDDKHKYHPSSRSLFSHLIRRGVEGYADPFEQMPHEKTWSKQINNAFLLDLDWKYASRIQELKDKENALKALKGGISAGLLPQLGTSIGQLEAESAVLEEELSVAQHQLSSFKVHPQYYEIEKSNNDFTQKIHEATNELTIVQQLLNKYSESLKEESDVSAQEVAEIYKEAGVSFSASLTKKLEEVQEFHKKLIENRKSYLEAEISELNRKVIELRSQIKELSELRAKGLSILKTHNALDEYHLLQERVAEKSSRLLSLRQNIKQLFELETEKSKLTIEKEEIFNRAREDFKEREEHLKKIITTFNSNSQFLYSEGGRLSIDVTKEGYKFDVEIKRANSQGVGYMKVFCYDLAIMEFNATKKGFFKVLVHDSTIFDGVDERQIALALELAQTKSEVCSFQYICTINSDMIPYSEFSEEFKAKFDESKIITLTDGDAKQSILGIRF